MKRLACFVGALIFAGAVNANDFCSGWKRADRDVKKTAVETNISKLSMSSSQKACLRSRIDYLVEWTDTVCEVGGNVSHKVYAQLLVDKARELCG